MPGVNKWLADVFSKKFSSVNIVLDSTTPLHTVNCIDAGVHVVKLAITIYL